MLVSCICVAAIYMIIFPVFYHVFVTFIMTERFFFSFLIRKTNNLGIQVASNDMFQRQIKLIMFNWQDLQENFHDSQMSWLRQSWPSLGKPHFQSSFRNQKTQTKSQIREDQAQARFQEQSWKAVKKERVHQRVTQERLQEKIPIAQHDACVQVQEKIPIAQHERFCPTPPQMTETRILLPVSTCVNGLSCLVVYRSYILYPMYPTIFGIMTPKLKDRITPQVNFFLK